MFLSLSLDLSFLFASIPFLSTSFPSPAPPSFDTARDLGERCKLHQRVRAEPSRQMELVNSGPTNERFLTFKVANYSVF